MKCPMSDWIVTIKRGIILIRLNDTSDKPDLEHFTAIGEITLATSGVYVGHIVEEFSNLETDAYEIALHTQKIL